MTPTELKRRRKYLGGSEIAAIMGWSPFSTAASVYDEKLGLVAPKDTSEAMEAGIFFEDGAAKWWAHKHFKNTGEKLILRKHRALVCPETRYFRASPDRIVTFPDGHREGLEIKCIGEFAARQAEWGRSGTNNYPNYYRAQCAWNRMIFGLERWNLVAIVADGRWSIKHYVYTEAKNPGFTGALRVAGLKFRDEHLLPKVRPPEPPRTAVLTDGTTISQAPDFMRASAQAFLTNQGE